MPFAQQGQSSSATFHGNYNDVAGDQYNFHYASTGDQASETILRKLKPVLYDATNRTECLDGTRTDLIQTITEWALNPAGAKNILWLYGLAGSGKSALSTTIANHLRDKACLGAFLFCDRDDSQRNDPSTVIRTMAYQLSSFHAGVRAAISTALQRLPDIHLSPMRSQFLHLLLNVLTFDGVIDPTTPIIIVLDAMDECGNPDSRETLLEVLAEMWTRLPPSIRLFITSRYENDIRGAFEGQEHVIAIELNIDSISNKNDISTYLRARLGRVRKKRNLQTLKGWPSDADIWILTQRASGLFVWASTASKFIDGFDPRARMNTVLKGDDQLAPERALDTLYRTALESVGNWDDANFLTNFVTVVGTVLVARHPLSPSALDALCRLDPGVSCSYTISFLGCLLQESPTVRLLHPSFADFLCDRSRCHREIWWFRLEEHNHKLAMNCLFHLNNVLKQNFCGIELSPHPVDNVIPEGISYACLCWVDHFTMTNVGARDVKSILSHLHTFFYRHLLHWIEIMSFLKKTRDIVDHLKALQGWILRNPDYFPYDYSDEYLDDFLGNTAGEIRAMISDAIRFVQLFAGDIETHPLLVYKIALPFAPTGTTLYKTFHNFRTCVSIIGSSEQSGESWPPLVQTFGTASEGAMITTCAYSPDNSRIVSGSFDGHVRVWDATSGARFFAEPMKHSISVLAVQFSPDGARIASGSIDRTIRLWDAISGCQVLQSLQGHRSGVTSLSFYTSSRRLVSGSQDTTVRVWSVQSGAEVMPALRGHNDGVEVVCVSGDGLLIASGSGQLWDQTIRTWDAVSGHQSRVFRIRGVGLQSLTFSFAPVSDLDLSTGPNRTYLEFGRRYLKSDPDRVYRARLTLQPRTYGRDGQEIDRLSPDIDMMLFPHTDRTGPMIIHPEGKDVVIDGDSSSILIWGRTGDRPSKIKPHSGVASLSFSTDGRNFCSGMYDGTICIWDTHSGEFHKTKARHTLAVQCVTFSPDGRFAISGSSDNTIRIWYTTSSLHEESVLVGHSGAVVTLACSPDGSHLASGSLDTTVITWDLFLGTQTLPPFCAHTSSVNAVIFSLDGRRVASGSDDGTIRVWDVSLGREILKPLQPGIPVKSVTFSPDGTLIASAEADGLDATIHVWDATSGSKVIVIPVPISSPAARVTFSLDGLRILAQCSKFVPGAAFTSRSGATTRVWSVFSGAEHPSLPSWQDTDPPKEINILEDGWIVNHNATQYHGRWPSILGVTCHAVHGRSLVVGTKDGRVLTMHFH